MDITIFEVHLPNAQFNAPFSSGSETEASAEEPEPDTVTESGGEGPKLAPIAMLAILLGLAALARYLKRPSQAELDEFETD